MAGPDSPQRCAMKRQEAVVTNCNKGISFEIKGIKREKYDGLEVIWSHLLIAGLYLN